MNDDCDACGKGFETADVVFRIRTKCGDPLGVCLSCVPNQPRELTTLEGVTIYVRAEDTHNPEALAKVQFVHRKALRLLSDFRKAKRQSQTRNTSREQERRLKQAERAKKQHA